MEKMEEEASLEVQLKCEMHGFPGGYEGDGDPVWILCSGHYEGKALLYSTYVKHAPGTWSNFVTLYSCLTVTEKCIEQYNLYKDLHLSYFLGLHNCMYVYVYDR